ncbi:MAG TPA: VIT1/CCC1 transporter family protein [Gemmatimonadales bacterium]
MTNHDADFARSVLEGRQRVLDPVDRFSEVSFGLMMVLTFTGSLSVATSGPQDVRQMLIGALGCNLAWGIVDGAMYVVTSAVERARRFALVRAVKGVDPPQARQLVLHSLPEMYGAGMTEAGLERVVGQIRAFPLPANASLVRREDLQGALLVLVLVFLATLPVALPFVFLRDPEPALRLSNLVAAVMMFGSGAALGRYGGLSPWRAGMAMLLLGLVLVAIIIALGG